MSDIFWGLIASLGERNIIKNEPLFRHTSFRIGGPADYYVTPRDEKGLRDVLSVAHEWETPVYVIGNGSNVLFGDGGYRGIVVQIGKEMGQMEWGDDNVVTVGAGAPLSTLAQNVAQKGWKGFEFAGGIPGSVGGAVVMNAGAYGGEIKDVLQSVRAISLKGEDESFTIEEMAMGYRTSVVQQRGSIVTSATFQFEGGDAEEILAKMKELNARRREKQPLEYPSAGSTFKRPEGHYAARLIEDAGLKGYREGDAMVSDKHAGFVVNVGNATAKEVLSVMKRVREEVLRKFGVALEPEVRVVGEI